MELVLWRAFPWDPLARAGAPFSASFVPEHQGQGRFDVQRSLVVYLAESPEHAVAEKLQGYRGRVLREPHLRPAGHGLALASARLSASARADIADLCDPDELARRRIRPDTLASRDYRRTRAIAEALYEDLRAGLRWWSAFSGDWHTIVAFCGRLGGAGLVFGEPEPLGLNHPVVRTAAAELGVRLAGTRRARR
jgi:hypothetical protein